jgi:transposase
MGKIVREVKVASEPEALLAVLKNPAYRFKRIGVLRHEARQVAAWQISSSSIIFPISCWRLCNSFTC